jgi:hypothetical protein
MAALIISILALIVATATLVITYRTLVVSRKAYTYARESDKEKISKELVIKEAQLRALKDVSRFPLDVTAGHTNMIQRAALEAEINRLRQML